MTARRYLLGLLVTLTATAGARAQAFKLAEDQLKTSNFRIELELNLTGELTVRQNGKEAVLKQSVQVRHHYLEHVMETGAAGLVDRAARIYQLAEGDIIVDGEKSSRKFRPERDLMMVHRQGDQIVVYCPKDGLSPEEFELTEHFDSLALPGLLPGKEVKVGETWKLTNAAVQALCDLDGLTTHALVGKLERVDGDQAQLSVSGPAQGIGLGAAVKLTINAAAQFDLKERRIVALQWKQSDERDQGPVSPGFKAEVVTTIKRTPIEQPEKLHPFVLVPYDVKTPPEGPVQISYTDPKGRFGLRYARDWHLVGRTDDYLVLRLLERGDFLAQMTIAPWHKADAGKHMPLQDFKAAMARAPGWEADKVIEEGEIKSERAGYTLYRVAAAGKHEGVDSIQYFYLVAGPQGDQTIVTFTMTPAQAAKMTGRDLAIVRNLVYSSATSAAAKDAKEETKAIE